MSAFDLNLLESLDALLRTRSVTEAARHLGVSQPTMSGMLARLREQLDDAILVRVGRGMELTPRATGLAPEVRQTLLRVARLTMPLTEFDPATVKRHFRIMTSEFGLFLVLPQVFHTAETTAPAVTFETVLIDQPAASVYSGSVDICLTGDILGGVAGDMAAVVRTQKVMEESFVGLVDAGHPLRDTVTLEELSSYPHVATQFPGSRWTVEDIGFVGMSRRHPPRIKVASFLAIGRIVAGGTAIGIVPRHMAALRVGNDDLRIVELPADCNRIAIRTLWHCRDDQDPAHRWLRALISAVCVDLEACPSSSAAEHE